MPYPTVQEVLARLEFDADEIGEDSARVHSFLQAHLDDLVVRACAIANRQWTNATMPAIVATCIRAAMVRYARRPEGNNVYRAGDENLGWYEEAGHCCSPTFTRDEVDSIRASVAPGRTGFGTISTTRFGPTRNQEDETLYAPIFGHTDQVPFASRNSEGRVRFP